MLGGVVLATAFLPVFLSPVRSRRVLPTTGLPSTDRPPARARHLPLIAQPGEWR